VRVQNTQDKPPKTSSRLTILSPMMALITYKGEVPRSLKTFPSEIRMPAGLSFMFELFFILRVADKKDLYLNMMKNKVI